MPSQPQSAGNKAAVLPPISRTSTTGWLPSANRMLLLALAAASLCGTINAQSRNAQSENVAERLSLRNVVEAINDQRMFDLAAVDKNAETASQAYPKTCETNTATAAGDTLSFYPPFLASDGIADVWCKLQTLHSDRPIEVSLTQDPNPGGRPDKIFVSGFSPDGNIHSSKADFIQHLVKEISRQAVHGGLFWQSVTNLNSLGIPDAANAPRNVFTGNLTMTVYGVQVSGVAFNISVTFAPQVGLITRQIENPSESICSSRLPRPKSRIELRTRLFSTRQIRSVFHGRSTA